MLNIITALHCEAKPLIDYFQLKKIIPDPRKKWPFVLFANDAKTIHLIVVGIGKVNMAAGVAFLQALLQLPAHAGFLNVGIAGATQFPVGQLVLAHKITEQSTRRSWYPFITPALKNLAQGMLMTHDVAQTDYPSIGLVDMEGSAFFQTAAHFVTHEHIQVVKIISDNTLTMQQQLNAVIVETWVRASLPAILQISTYLQQLSETEATFTVEPPALAAFQTRWHFTYAQTLQLTTYLRRWQNLQKNKDPLLFCQSARQAKQVIEMLAQHLLLTNHPL